MQRIVIPVDEKVAFSWHQTTPEERAKIVGIFSWMIEQGAWRDFTPATFKKMLDDVSDSAVEKGLTPEILDEILHES